MKSLKVFIFSYNRGPLLNNCVNSALECLHGCQVYVIDDLSSDPETVNVISKLPVEVKLIKPRSGSKERHGGLYENMNFALSICNDDDMVVFVQDDMQFVRPLLEFDFEYIESYFKKSRSPFLYPAFLKLANYDSLSLQIEQGMDYYICNANSTITGSYYSDVVIANIKILRNSEWKFRGGELENAKLAKTLFDKMGYMANPFLMYLPRPPVFRSGDKNIVIIFLETIFRFGFHPIKIMLIEEALKFCERNKKMLPVAESYLSARSGVFSRPWIYSVFDVHPIVYPLYNISRNPVFYLKYYFKKYLIN